MGLEVALQDENGDRLSVVADPANMLHRILPGAGDVSFPHLRQIDWYGDTVFNRQQARELLPELEGLLAQSVGEDERVLLKRIIELVRRCLNEVHLYVKFIGD